MSELPWFKFVIAHWMLDRNLAKCSSATRGVWLELIIAMHQDDRSGELRETADHLAQLARTTTVTLSEALTELQTTGTADVTFRNNIVTVVNRRMKREYNERKSTALRVKKHRSNKNVTPGETSKRKDSRDKSKEKEGDFLWVWDDEKRKFFEDGPWQIKFTTHKRISVLALQALMQQFVTDLELKQDYKDVKDLQAHFTNWYNKTKGGASPIGKTEAPSGPPLKRVNHGI
jgi:hypothetical protein